MFIIATAILLYMMAALVVLYARQKPAIDVRPPTSLAEMYSLLYASNAKDYCGPGMSTRERVESLSGTYGCGWFEGGDGKGHYGVYREREAAGASRG